MKFEHQTAQQPTEGNQVRQGTWRSLILLSAWFGLIAGLSEVALRIIQKVVLDQRIFISQQFVWMAPLADVIFYGVLGVLVAAIAWRSPRKVGVAAVTFLGTFVFIAAPLLMIQRLHTAAALLLALGMGYQAARYAWQRSDRVLRVAHATVAPMAMLVILMAAGVNGWRYLGENRRLAALPEPASDVPNVVLLILDTVRAASLRLYGYDRQTTPNIDRLSREAVVFERAIATAPWTLPSHASMFTGHFPDRLDADWKSPLGKAHPTLAEMLAGHGYLTGGFTANLLYTTYETGLDRGFTRYEDYPVSLGMVIASSFPARLVAGRIRQLAGRQGRFVQRSAEDVNRGFMRWLNAHEDDGRPFFAFLNYFDAHDPYVPPAPFDTLFGGTQHTRTPSQARAWTSAEVTGIRDAYDAEIAYVDHQIGLLIDDLERRQMLDRTILIVASDHGEQFGEHGLVGHANSLYSPLLHVPLMIRLPGGAADPSRVDETVSLADLPATILHLAGVANDGIPGVPLIDSAGLQGKQKSRVARAFVSKMINMPGWLPASQGDMASVTVGPLHYIRNADDTEELYDLFADSLETRSLAGSSTFRHQLTSLRRIASTGSDGAGAARTGTGAATSQARRDE